MDDGTDIARPAQSPAAREPRGIFGRWLKRLEAISPDELMPPTLMARAGLAIVVPLILVQAISTYIFYDKHMDMVSQRLAEGLSHDVVAIRTLMLEFPPGSREQIASLAKRTVQLTAEYEPGAKLKGSGIVTKASDAEFAWEEILWDKLRQPFRVDRAAYRMALQVSIDMQMPDGVLHVLVPRSRMFTGTTYVFVIWMIGSSILLFGAAAVFLRGQVQSVRRLAQVADEFGKGRDVPDFPAEGAFEVRQVARAFNIMRARVRRQLAQRTEMLAGVSHDLRTPLTRMKLQLAMMQNAAPDDVAALKDDLTEMERMLDGYLAFARGEGSEESAPTDLPEVLETMVARFRREGRHIVLTTGENLPRDLKLKPLAFERALGNLLTNAVHHGSAVTVIAERLGRTVEIHVDDNGPGIAPDKREEVFRAFHRLEPSRNPRTGGIGLGLTVARDIIRGMGGDIILGDGPLGGLRATLRVPV